MVCEPYLRNPWQVKIKSKHFALSLILLFKGLHIHWKIFRDLWCENSWKSLTWKYISLFSENQRDWVSRTFLYGDVDVFPSYPHPTNGSHDF